MSEQTKSIAIHFDAPLALRGNALNDWILNALAKGKFVQLQANQFVSPDQSGEELAFKLLASVYAQHLLDDVAENIFAADVDKYDYLHEAIDFDTLCFDISKYM